MNRVICGDCLEVMPTLPDKSINLIITDPPYNIKRGEWDNIPDYMSWCGKWVVECQRLLKGNGSFYFFHNDFLKIVELQKWIEQNTTLTFKQLITWFKVDYSFHNYGFAQKRLSNGGMTNYYGGFTEYCLYYSFESTHTQIADYMRSEKEKAYGAGWTDKELRKLCGVSLKGGGLLSHFWGNKQWQIPTKHVYEKLQKTGFWKKPYRDIKTPFNLTKTTDYIYGNSNVWKYPPAPQRGHVTPKPVNLVENIILHSSNEGDMVFDCFAGSGTTAIACLNTNRNYVLIEKEKEYIDIINKRIAEHEIQTTLFEGVVKS